ncbi:microtubule motor protein [Aureococcus anophagefferens]|uniref:Microtubule motor protein n=1 Tax=Aureococcus anophagefferens TaxID=44056 RepID=A0ABR1FWL4_AURAN
MEERVRAALRLRPVDRAAERSLRVEGDEVIVKARGGNGQLSHRLDKVFGEDASQSEVFEWVTPAVADVARRGVHATIFAYGQTGTGKTHTMMGDIGEGGLGDRAGIIPRAAAALFETLGAGAAAMSIVRSTVHCSYMQIYGDRVMDMLADGRSGSLAVRETPFSGARGSSKSIFVQGLSEYQVTSAGDVLSLVARGDAARATRATDHNAQSSRSHAILQLALEVESVETGDDAKQSWRSQFADGGDAAPPSADGGAARTVIRRAKLSLVDLAGSEKWSDSATHDKALASELRAINKSLSALGNCIAALADLATQQQGAAQAEGGRVQSRGSLRSHVPYRDSTLTRLLQDALGGGTRAVVIATASAAASASDETNSTLAFAQRATRVTATLRFDEVVNDGLLLKKAQREISRLRRQLQRYQTSTPSPLSSPPAPLLARTCPPGFSGRRRAAKVAADRAERRAEAAEARVALLEDRHAAQAAAFDARLARRRRAEAQRAPEPWRLKPAAPLPSEPPPRAAARRRPRTRRRSAENRRRRRPRRRSGPGRRRRGRRRRAGAPPRPPLDGLPPAALDRPAPRPASPVAPAPAAAPDRTAVSTPDDDDAGPAERSPPRDRVPDGRMADASAAKLAALLLEYEADGMSLEACFDAIDADGSGLITAQELWDGLTSLGDAFEDLTRADVWRVIFSIDEDKNGSIDKAELAAFVARFRARREPPRDAPRDDAAADDRTARSAERLARLLGDLEAQGVPLATVFATIDANANGFITATELYAGLKSQGPAFADLTVADAWRLVRTIDLDRNGSVDLPELEAFVAKFRAETPPTKGSSQSGSLIEDEYSAQTTAVPGHDGTPASSQGASSDARSEELPELPKAPETPSDLGDDAPHAGDDGGDAPYDFDFESEHSKGFASPRPKGVGFAGLGDDAPESPARSVGFADDAPSRSVGFADDAPARGVGFADDAPARSVGFAEPARSVGFADDAPARSVGFSEPARSVGFADEAAPRKAVGFAGVDAYAAPSPDSVASGASDPRVATLSPARERRRDAPQKDARARDAARGGGGGDAAAADGDAARRGDAAAADGVAAADGAAAAAAADLGRAGAPRAAPPPGARSATATASRTASSARSSSAAPRAASARRATRARAAAPGRRALLAARRRGLHRCAGPRGLQARAGGPGAAAGPVAALRAPRPRVVLPLLAPEARRGRARAPRRRAAPPTGRRRWPRPRPTWAPRPAYQPSPTGYGQQAAYYAPQPLPTPGAAYGYYAGRRGYAPQPFYGAAGSPGGGAAYGGGAPPTTEWPAVTHGSLPIHSPFPTPTATASPSPTPRARPPVQAQPLATPQPPRPVPAADAPASRSPKKSPKRAPGAAGAARRRWRARAPAPAAPGQRLLAGRRGLRRRRRRGPRRGRRAAAAGRRRPCRRRARAPAPPGRSRPRRARRRGPSPRPRASAAPAAARSARASNPYAAGARGRKRGEPAKALRLKRALTFEEQTLGSTDEEITPSNALRAANRLLRQKPTNRPEFDARLVR